MTKVEKEDLEIKKEYKEWKSCSISFLRSEWSRHNRVGNPKELDKEGLVSDLLRCEYGNKKVDRAFKIVVSKKGLVSWNQFKNLKK